MSASDISLEEREANRFAICALDCEDANRYLHAGLELQEIDDVAGNSQHWDAREACIVAAIVSYGRAFTESKHDGSSVKSVNVNLDDALLGDEPKKKLHQLILDLRHQAAAHSDWNMRRSDRKEDSPGGGVMRSNPAVMYGTKVDIKQFVELTDSMKNYFRSQSFDRDRKHPRPPSDDS